MPHAFPQLVKLTQIKDVFGVLIRGRHLNRLHDGALWNELDRERDTYDALFTQLGYQLVIDERGFAWFDTDEPAQNIANRTRNLALLMLALFERQADVGMGLPRFHEWMIDSELLAEVLERSRTMLESEGLSNLDQLANTMGTAVSYGFAVAESTGRWRLLPATWRYLDSFEEISAQHEAVVDGVLEDQE